VARHFVYILECADGTLYTGYTTDPARRVKEHNTGKGSRYTRSRLPVDLAYLEELASRSQALKREKRIKKLGKGSKLLLTSGFRRLMRHRSR
jgi:putative endonuclease